MKYKVLEIPGNTTIYEDNPEVTVIRNHLSGPHLSIKYAAVPLQHLPSHTVHTYGLLIFSHVLEYRWVHGDVSYPHFTNDTSDGSGEFTLIEIEDSKWIEMMTLQSGYLQAIKLYPERLRKITIIHYRLTFDEYGVFDILARDFMSKEIVEEVPIS